MSHKASSSSVTSQTQIFVHLWKSPLYHILPASNPACTARCCRSTNSCCCNGSSCSHAALQGCDPSHQLPWPLHHHTGCQCLPLQRMLPFVWTGAPHERLQVNIFVSLHVARRYRSRDSSELQRGHRRLLRNLAGCLSGSASSRQIASEVC